MAINMASMVSICIIITTIIIISISTTTVITTSQSVSAVRRRPVRKWTAFWTRPKPRRLVRMISSICPTAVWPNRSAKRRPRMIPSQKPRSFRTVALVVVAAVVVKTSDTQTHTDNDVNGQQVNRQTSSTARMSSSWIQFRTSSSRQSLSSPVGVRRVVVVYVVVVVAVAVAVVPVPVVVAVFFFFFFRFPLYLPYYLVILCLLYNASHVYSSSFTDTDTDR